MKKPRVVASHDFDVGPQLDATITTDSAGYVSMDVEVPVMRSEEL